MKVKRLLLLASLAALAAFVIGGTPVAQGDDTVHPAAPCTWGVTKTASLHGSTDPITSLDLALNETVTVDYTIVVTRDCTTDHFDPFGEGGSADVKDSYAGILAQHLFLDTTAMHVSKTFTYSRDITAASCDSFDVSNTVDVVDGDPLHPFATTTNTIHVNVHCGGGCTLTQGYWKTHSTYGPAAKADPAWNLLPGGLGPDTPFFSSGQTWLQVFTTAPKGNAYYILADQYMAAVLNQLNGASSTSAVDAAISYAQTFFGTYTPATAGALAKSSSVRAAALAAATTLDNYNNGLIGPGHCSESS